MTLEILKSAALSKVGHGFFTRKGGTSNGIYSGLNCGPGSADKTENIVQNRMLVAEAMGVSESMLATVHQIHSPDVLTVEGPIATPRPQCDAMVTRMPGTALGILTADCQPVLFADPKNGVVGAAHAGWKGALAGVLQSTVDAMIDIGAERENITAVVGPCISQKAYEVGPEFPNMFKDAAPAHNLFFIEEQGDRLLFDLPGFGLYCLNEAGVGTAEWTGHCTFTDSDRFFSYRRATHANETDYGRLISVIRL